MICNKVTRKKYEKLLQKTSICFDDALIEFETTGDSEMNPNKYTLTHCLLNLESNIPKLLQPITPLYPEIMKNIKEAQLHLHAEQLEKTRNSIMDAKTYFDSIKDGLEEWTDIFFNE